MSNAPFIHTDNNIAVMQLKLITALVPCITYAVFSYGIRALILVVFCALLWFLSDLMTGALMHTDNVQDLSPVSSGIIVALLLPPGTSLYIAAAATLFGAIVMKALFGGPGASFVHPAAAGRLFVELCFPMRTRGFAAVGEKLLYMRSLIDTDVPEGMTPFDYPSFRPMELAAGNYPTYIGTGCLVIILAGAAYLMVKKAVRLEAPLGFLVTVILGRLIIDIQYDPYNTLVFVMTSGIAFSAFFLMSDVYTSVGRGVAAIVSGMVCGFVAVMVSLLGNDCLTMLVPVMVSGLISEFIKFADVAGRHAPAKGGEDLA